MPRRRIASAPGVAAFCAAIALGLTVAGCGGTSAAPHTTPRARLESLIQDENVVLANPAAAMREFASLGADRVRIIVPWSSIAPDSTATATPSGDLSDPETYPAANWAPFDAIVDAAAHADMKLLFTLTAPAPRWALGPDPHTVISQGTWRPSAAAFGAFVHAIGERYDGRYTPAGTSTPLPRVGDWEIWNEPNYGQDLSPQATGRDQVNVSPRLYRGLVDAAWSALVATGHGPGTDTILIGATAPRGSPPLPGLPGNGGGMLPLRFIRSLYCVGSNLEPLRGPAARSQGCPSATAGARRFRADHPGLFEATGFSDHPYPDLLPPTVRTPPPGGTDYADFAALPNLEATLDGAFRAYGSSVQIPIYSTEFGYITVPSDKGLPYATAASYLNESEYLTWLNPRLRDYDQYMIVDPVPNAQHNFLTGLETAAGKHKPDVFDSYVMPLYLPSTAGSLGSALEVWGCARPAPRIAEMTGQPQRVAIQFARRGNVFRTLGRVTLDPQRGGCYFTAEVKFPGSGSVRLAWSGGGLSDMSRTQTIILR